MQVSVVQKVPMLFLTMNNQGHTCMQYILHGYNHHVREITGDSLDSGVNSFINLKLQSASRNKDNFIFYIPISFNNLFTNTVMDFLGLLFKFPQLHLKSVEITIYYVL